jgi:hypothetical protein
MKKILLSIAVITGLSVSAQTTGHQLTFTDATSNCYFNLPTPGTNGHMNGDANTFITLDKFLFADGFKLSSISDLASLTDAKPHWFSIATPDDADQCSNFAKEDKGIDLSNNSKVAIDIQSNLAGAGFEFFLGGEGEWSPSSSTYNTLQADPNTTILASGTIANADEKTTIVFDYNTLNATAWSGWSGKSKIQSYGFRSTTDDAVFVVSEIRFGDKFDVSVDEVVASGLNIFPNPAIDVLNINFKATSATVLELVDITGKVVSSQLAQAGSVTTSFNTVDINSGVYFVNVKNASGSTTQKVVVK